MNDSQNNINMGLQILARLIARKVLEDRVSGHNGEVNTSYNNPKFPKNRCDLIKEKVTA